jgi:hypothetical protein
VAAEIGRTVEEQFKGLEHFAKDIGEEIKKDLEGL